MGLDVGVAVHLGVEDDFRPARKAHPAFVVADLDAICQRLTDAGAEIVEDDSIDVRRCYTADPFSNRIELVAAGDRGFTTRGARGEGAYREPRALRGPPATGSDAARRR